MRLLPAFAIAALALALTAPALAQAPLVSVDLGHGVRLDLVLVPAGTFDEGSPPTEAGRADDEALHRVTLSKAHYLGKVPVTRGQFARFVEDSGYRTEAEKGASGGSGFDGKGLTQRKDFTWRTPGFPQTDDHPVTLVTYDDATAFAGWLTGKGGRRASLPTEAQWEHAARAGTKTRYYAGEGDESAAVIGWFNGNAGNGTRPVGQKKPNAYGLQDMGGDVFEWCRDWYAPYPREAVTDPEQSAQVTDGDKPRRVLRGGSWLKDRKNLRSAARARQAPGSRNADNGFRVAASVDLLPAAAPVPATPPPAPPPPSPSSPPDGGGVSFFSVVFFGIIGIWVLMFGFIVSRFVRRRQPALGAFPGGAAEELPTTPAADGFWIKIPSRLDGAQLAFRYRLAGEARSGTVAAEISDRGLFVYTGGPPQDVHVWVPAPAGSTGGGGYRGPVVTSRVVSSQVVIHEHHHHDDRPFTGFPSAY